MQLYCMDFVANVSDDFMRIKWDVFNFCMFCETDQRKLSMMTSIATSTVSSNSRFETKLSGGVMK